MPTRYKLEIVTTNGVRVSVSTKTGPQLQRKVTALFSKRQENILSATVITPKKQIVLK